MRNLPAHRTICRLVGSCRRLPHHLLTVRTTLDGFDIADPTAFAARLHKAG